MSGEFEENPFTQIAFDGRRYAGTVPQAPEYWPPDTPNRLAALEALAASGGQILNGLGAPASIFGDPGDFYIDTVTYDLYGPKTGLSWGLPVSLIGPSGINGLNGVDGRTIINGTAPPTPGDGVDGDFWIDTVNFNIWGPKALGTWTLLVSLVGPAGPTGPAGTPGSVWHFGSGVPAGALGVDGDYYLDTVNGDVYFKSLGAWGFIDNLTGPMGATGAAGPAGADGSTILNGTVAPTGGDGADGDFWIDTVANQIYGPKTLGAWGAGTSIVGPTGATGAAGTDGNTIVSGVLPPTGADGVNGDYFYDQIRYEWWGPKTVGVWPPTPIVLNPNIAIQAVDTVGGVLIQTGTTVQTIPLNATNVTNATHFTLSGTDVEINQTAIYKVYGEANYNQLNTAGGTRDTFVLDILRDQGGGFNVELSGRDYVREASDGGQIQIQPRYLTLNAGDTMRLQLSSNIANPPRVSTLANDCLLTIEFVRFP